jgi:uncharacterized protein (TIGR02145 family)
MKACKYFQLFITCIIAVALITGCKKKDDDNNNNNNNNNLPNPDPVTDIDGNVYQTVRIGNQIWMAANLRVSRYNNGDSITYGTTNTIWSSTEGRRCYYNDSLHHLNKYGYLYNYYALVDSRKICPPGYRVPTFTDWETLINHLGGNLNALKKLKAKHTWHESDTLNNNSSGFSALPGGYRDQLGGYHGLYGNAYFWTSSESVTDKAWWFRLRSGNTEPIESASQFKKYGASCRCIKE